MRGGMTRLIARLLALFALPFILLAQPATAREAHPALWVVKDQDTTIYLFGTVHVLPPDIDWFGGPVKKAFESAQQVMLEIVMPDQAAMAQKMLSLAVDPSGKPLSTKLDPAALAKYQAELKLLGVPETAFEPLEPWFVATALSVMPLKGLGYDPATGVERALTATATQEGKPIGGLETIDQQIGYFDTLPEPLQIKFLNSTVDELPTLAGEMETMVDAWATGDADKLGRVMNESLDENPEIGKILLADRNARWAAWVKARLDQPGVVFVAVGAGHLAGPDSVQAKLKALGVASERVKD